MAGKAKSKTSPPQKACGGEEGEPQAHFVDGLITRGEAVGIKSKSQKLPTGVTHWIKSGGENERPKVKRGRFSLT
jgi:hypothetical protein